MRIRAYVDESGTHPDADYMVIGGVLSPVSIWPGIESGWQMAISAFNADKPIRAKQLLRMRSNKELVDALFAHGYRFIDFGLTVTFKRSDFKERYKNHPAGSGLHLDSEYGLLFGCWIETARDLIDGVYNGRAEELEVVLEQSQHWGRAAAVFEAIERDQPSRTKVRLSGISVGEKSMAGIQAADMAAHMGWRRETAQEPSVPGSLGDISPSLLERAVGDDPPVFRVNIQATQLEDFVKQRIEAAGRKATRPN